MNAKKNYGLAAAAAAAALVLAACGGNDSTGGADTSPGTTTSAPASDTAGRHNQADVTFAQVMIPHHRQAIVMSDMAETRAASSDVKSLASKIEKAQRTEIETMVAWLRAWGERVPEGLYGMGGHGNASSIPGMMNNQQLNGMRDTSGEAFDTMFLTMMIEHHEGAVEMAETEKKQGAYGPAKDLADDIITTQTAEITQMRQMLDTG